MEWVRIIINAYLLVNLCGMVWEIYQFLNKPFFHPSRVDLRSWPPVERFLFWVLMVFLCMFLWGPLFFWTKPVKLK